MVVFFFFSTPAIILMTKPPVTSVDSTSLQDSGLSTATSSSLDEPPFETSSKEPTANIEDLEMQLNEAGPVTLALAGLCLNSFSIIE